MVDVLGPGCKQCFTDQHISDIFSSLTGPELLRWAKKAAIHMGAQDGDALHWLGRGYGNENLLFWDSESQEIIPPYVEIDDYGSVPPRFLVENDGFNPEHWLSDVVHNSYVILGDELVEEIRELLRETPEDTVNVFINGRPYTVRVERRYAVGNVATVVSDHEFIVDFVGWVDDDEQFHGDWDDNPDADVGEYVEAEEDAEGNAEGVNEGNNQGNNQEEEEDWEENFENEEEEVVLPVVNENALRATLPHRTVPSGTKNDMLAENIEAGNIMTNMMLNATRSESSEGRYYRKSTVNRMGMNPYTKKPIEGRVNYVANLAPKNNSKKGGRKTRKQRRRKTRRVRRA